MGKKFYVCNYLILLKLTAFTLQVNLEPQGKLHIIIELKNRVGMLILANLFH